MNVFIRKPTNAFFKVLVITFLLCSMLPLEGCDKDKVKRVLGSGDRISSIGDTAIAALPVLRDEGLIDESEQQDLTLSLTGVKESIDDFISKSRSYKELNPNAKSELAAAFAGVEGALDRFNANGVLHLKNPKAQNRARLWLSAMRVAARVIRSFLEENDQ
jgi:hypothetical protein